MEIVRFLGASFNIRGVLPGNGKNFVFWHFSVTYKVSFTKIICINLPNRLKVFFVEFNFLTF